MTESVCQTYFSIGQEMEVYLELVVLKNKAFIAELKFNGCLW